MSGAKPFTTVQLIDSCIGIAKLILELDRVARDAPRVPPRLRALIEKVPLTENHLESARDNCEEDGVTEDAKTVAQPVVKPCEQALGEPRDIFRKAPPKNGENANPSLRQGTETVFLGRTGHAREVLQLMQENLKHQGQEENGLLGDKLDELQELVEVLDTDDPGKYLHSGSGRIFGNEG